MRQQQTLTQVHVTRNDYDFTALVDGDGTLFDVSEEYAALAYEESPTTIEECLRLGFVVLS